MLLHSLIMQTNYEIPSILLFFVPQVDVFSFDIVL